MTVSNPSSLVGFDADETTRSLYANEDEMRAHFEEVVSYVHVDFMEKDLFEDVFRAAGGVRSFVAYMDHVTLVRVLVGREGLFFTVDRDVNVTGLVETVGDVIGA